MTNKMTKKDYFNALLGIEAVQANEALVEFIEKELALLAKRNSADSKAKQAKAAENAALADKVVEFLASVDEAQAALAIATAIGVSTQKVTPILANLVTEGRVTKSTEKRKNLYAIAA